MKKTVTIIAFVLTLFCISKVQAFSDGSTINRTEEKLENLIEIKTSENEENWEFVSTEKYTADKNNMIIYKIGNEKASEDGIYLQYLTYDAKIQRIIKNGYMEKEPSEYGLSNENDLYLATKIALDCIENNTEKEDVDKFYRAGTLLTGDQKARAENIIKATKEILDKGINGKETYTSSMGVGPIGEIEKDNIRKGYYSQLYKVDIKGGGCKGYKVEEIGENSLEYIIANANTSEEQKDFSVIENQFKILIPEAHKHDDFTIEIKLSSEFLGENFYIGTDYTNKYIVFAKEYEEKILSTKLHNKRSSLALKFLDEETLENVYGVKVEVDGQMNLINKYGNIVKTNIPKSTVHVKVISLPKDYEIENTDYDIDIVYNEEHIETIKLKHKKGKIEVTTNAGEGVYEIYDLDSKKIVPQITKDDGNVYVADMNTGKYKLKQIGVNNEYELANDIEFEIKHKETTKITVENTLKEKIKEDEEDDTIDPKDENEENDGKENQSESDEGKDNDPNISKEENPQNGKEDNSQEAEQDSEKQKETEENKKQEEQNEKEENNQKQEESEQNPNLGEPTQDKTENPKLENKDKNEKEDTNNSDNKQEDNSNKETENKSEVEEPKKEENNQGNTNDKEELKKDSIENDNKETLANRQEKDNSNINLQEQNDEEINKSNSSENIENLPRTGNDYFLIKLISINSLLFTFFIFLFNKKTDCKNNLNSLHIPNFKE